MNSIVSVPQVYLDQCEVSFQIKEAVVYNFDPIYVKKVFYDASGGPFATAPVDTWLEITDDNGVTGQAPCTPLMRTNILPLIVNRETHTYREWYQKLYWAIRNNGFSGETANELGRLDLALHDLMAKRAGLPLHRFLGASRDWAKVYASACGTNLTFDECVEELEDFLNLGYDTFKIKCGTNFGTQLEHDVEKVRIARETIGPDKRLAVDVNQIWTADQAMAYYDMIAKYDIAWYEEPVHSHDFRELAKLTRMCPSPISMGESVKNYYMLEEYVYCGCRHLQPITTNMCCIGDWMKGRKLAYDNKIEFSSGGISPLAASYVASGREEDMVEYLTPIMRPLNKYMKVTPEERDGKFYLADIPGAGFVPDFGAFRRDNLIRSIEFIRA